MRIGLLSFGSLDAQTPFADALRARDVDVVTTEDAVTSFAIASDEAARIARADCDGVVLLVSDATVPAHVGQAGLLLGCPLLLAGPFGATFLDAAGALAEVGISFNRRNTQTGILVDRVRSFASLEEAQVDENAQWFFDWAQTNNKQERQRGYEAARKLYGQRFALPPGTVAPLDPVLWRRQFGVTVVPFGEDADFSAPDGDVNAALTHQLLKLISGGETSVESVNVDTMTEAHEGATHTFAQIARRAGRYICITLPGMKAKDDFGTDEFAVIAHIPWQSHTFLSGKLQAVPGDLRGALRAACESLDIELIPLDERLVAWGVPS